MPSVEDIRACFNAIMDGEISQIQMAAADHVKMQGERVEDIAAAAAVMREKATIIDAPDSAMDIVGTGGDGIGTYNISTATAFVVAGAACGTSMEQGRIIEKRPPMLFSLGIEVDCDMGWCAAPLSRPDCADGTASPFGDAACAVRAELGVRTIFNMPGLLANPALVRRIMVGVFDPALCVPFAEALAALGTTHAWVVHGADGLDEVSTTGPTQVAALAGGAVTQFAISPDDLGLATVGIEALHGGTPDENADSLRAVLDGADGPYRDIVIFNAAAALVGGGHAADLADGAERAITSIASGRAMAALDTLVTITNGNPEGA